MIVPVAKRFVRIAAITGIIVCSAWTITDLSLGLYKEASMYAFFTAANGITLLLYRRK